MALSAGDRLGSYEILALLGEGGMGVVWKARDGKLGRLVAIKVIKEAGQGDRLERLIQEARAAAQLNHPNVVIVHEISEQDGLLFVVMEFIDGEPLAKRIGRRGLAFPAALQYAIPIVRALEAAHKAGIIHRDLKPSNVMIATSGDVKLLDFGMAKLIHAPASADSEAATMSLASLPKTEEGKIVGTIAYMSPEQAQGIALDARSDLFSFGTVLYEMLTGRRPFEGENKVSTLAAILHREPMPLSRLSASALPPEIERIVMRCLRKDPERRFQTASDLRAALEDLKEESDSGHLQQAPVAPPPRRLPWWQIAAAATLFAGLVIGGLWFVRSPRRSEPAHLRQLTFDAGIAATPALSQDGRLLAFASDRAEPGNLDIWLRQIAGGSPIRLTSQPGAEVNPQFSPDGTKLYYLAGDQAIFEMPALGGPGRKVVESAGPFTVSSRGEIAFVRFGPGARSGPMLIVPSGGGSPEPWQPGCRSASRPAWSPDAASIFFFGGCGDKLRGGLTAARRDGVPKIAITGATAPVSGFTTAWFRLADGKQGFLFPSRTGGSVNLFRAVLDGKPVTVTTGTSLQLWPAVAQTGTTVFAQSEETTGIWSLALDGGQPVAPPNNIVSANGHFSVSRDGTTIVFGRLLSENSGELVVRNLLTGHEKVFAEHELLGVSIGSIWPQVSPDGEQIVYRLVGEQGGHYLLRVNSGEVRRVATLDHFQLGSDWSTDSKRVLGECPAPKFGICELDPASGTVKTLLVHDKDQLLYPSWSWDGRALAFMRRRPGGPAGIWVAPIHADGGIAPEAEWVPVSPSGTDNSRPRFSADGTAVYFVMGRDGARLLAAQQLDKTSHKPVGQATLLVRTPIELTLLTGGLGPYPLVAISRQRLFYSTIGLRGNLWMTRLE